MKNEKTTQRVFPCTDDAVELRSCYYRERRLKLIAI